MNQELLLEIKDNINQLKYDGLLDGAQIFLFGMNTPGDRVIQYLNTLGYEVQGILDNNVVNQGKTMLGISVFSPDILCEKEKSSIRVLICSKYYSEMKEQLLGMDCVKEEYVFRLLTYGQSGTINSSKEAFDSAKEHVEKGAEFLEQIMNRHEEGVFFLVPISANGDAFLASILAIRYQEKHNGKKVVLICIGEFYAKIIHLFGCSAEVVSQEMMDDMVSCVGLLGDDLSNVRVLHPRSWHFSILYRLTGYKKMNYLQLLAVSIGEAQLFSNIQKIDFLKPQKTYESFLSEKSIVLSPYANSLPIFPVSFWEDLADALLARGYTVYTNSGGDLEPVIKHTEKLFLPIEEMICVMDRVKAFIAIRNGLCDVLSRCSCKKIIIYPKKGMEQGTVFDCYSLNRMGLCDDAKEIFYAEDRQKEVLEEILCEFR